MLVTYASAQTDSLSVLVMEKFPALVRLGMANCRMKDCYDVRTLARQLQYDGNAFLRKRRLIDSPPPFAEVVTILASFLMPPMQALNANAPWDPG